MLKRFTVLSGTPGAGKTYFVIRNAIIQQIKKGYCMFLYDFKYNDLSKIAYNALLKYHKNYKVPPAFYVINFDKPMHRCNPLVYNPTHAGSSSLLVTIHIPS